MPHCPKCLYEYASGVTVCPDCDESLVPNLAVEKQAIAEPVDQSWYAVCGVGQGLKTEMAKGALDSGNIPSTILPNNHLSGGAAPVPLDPSHAEWTGGPNVILVPWEFREDAELLLRGVLGDEFVEINNPT